MLVTKEGADEVERQAVEGMRKMTVAPKTPEGMRQLQALQDFIEPAQSIIPAAPLNAELNALSMASRPAGAAVSDEEVYLSIHEDIANGSADQVSAKVNMMVLAMLSIISPPISRKLSDEMGDAPKKP